jgi:hypothetical protein
MSKSPATDFAKDRGENQRESPLLPMLIGGLALALVGMLVIVMFV